MKIRLSVARLFTACVLLLCIGSAHAGDAAAGKEKAVVCQACHGADGKSLLPEYPNLAGQGEAYLVKQLQDYKSGARENSLMYPLASALSDEDMADIAAFYGQLPAIKGVASEENLTAGENIYRGGITAAGIASCIGCHGPAGKGNPAAVYPALTGQNAAYTTLQLEYFRSGARANDPNGMMRNLAHRLSDAEIAAVSNYIQGLN